MLGLHEKIESIIAEPSENLEIDVIELASEKRNLGVKYRDAVIRGDMDVASDLEHKIESIGEDLGHEPSRWKEDWFIEKEDGSWKLKPNISDEWPKAVFKVDSKDKDRADFIGFRSPKKAKEMFQSEKYTNEGEMPPTKS